MGKKLMTSQERITGGILQRPVIATESKPPVKTEKRPTATAFIARARFTANTKKILKLEDVFFAEDIPVVEELLAENHRLERHVESVAQTEPRNIIHEARQKYATDPSDKNFANLKGLQETKDSLERQFKLVRRTARFAHSEFLKNKVVPLMEKFFRRAAKVLQEKADKLEAQEKENAEDIGIPFVKSDTLHSLKEAAVRMTAISNDFEDRKTTAALQFAALFNALPWEMPKRTPKKQNHFGVNFNTKPMAVGEKELAERERKDFGATK